MRDKMASCKVLAWLEKSMENNKLLTKNWRWLQIRLSVSTRWMASLIVKQQY